MPERDLVLLTTAARQAGQIAMQFWQKSPKVWDKDGDEGPVTEADIAVNDMLHQILCAARPDYGWLSEEGPDDPSRRDCDHVFIIDPIDGTRAFIAGDRSFSHSLAVARQGRITSAVVYLPAKDRLYAATKDGPATVNGVPIRCSAQIGIDGASLLTPKTNLAPDHWIGEPPDVIRAFRASVAYRLSLVADGAFDGMLSFRQAWEWDIAAGALIAQRAGAVVTDRTGAALQFNRANPRSNGLVAAAPGFHAALIKRMKS